jgi:DNA-binding NtrC family response regulator
VFEEANGDKALTGKILGISRATLNRKLKRYKIPVKDEGELPETESQSASQ